MLMEVRDLFKKLRKLVARNDVDDVHMFAVKSPQLQVRPRRDANCIVFNRCFKQVPIDDNDRQVKL